MDDQQNRYTIADIAIYGYAHVAGDAGIDLGDHPPVQAWCERVAAQDGYVDDLEPYPPNAQLGAGRSISGRRLGSTPIARCAPEPPAPRTLRSRRHMSPRSWRLATVRRRMLGERVVMVARPGLGGHRNE